MVSQLTRVQVLLMCQLRHPNIISAEDIYLPSDIPVEHRDNGMRLQRSNTDHICVRMPYYPADMAWLIHSSPQVLTPEHVQVMLWPCRGSIAALRAVVMQCLWLMLFCSIFLCRSCAAFGTLPAVVSFLSDFATRA